jgi:hypothetical protein
VKLSFQPHVLPIQYNATHKKCPEHGVRCAELIWSFLRRASLYTSPTSGLGKPMFRVIFTAAIGISGLNYYWFYKMCRGAFKEKVNFQPIPEPQHTCRSAAEWGQ